MNESELATYSITFQGKVLERGFWVYVIDIHSPIGRCVYVGRTGDSSSANAGSPFARIGQHLDSRPTAKGNALARNLREIGIEPSSCSMEMIAVGPLFPEEHEFGAHRIIRDRIAAVEAGLASALRARGYKVIGKHPAARQLDSTLLSAITSLIDRRLGGGQTAA